jgi:hypothetical protein
MPSSLREHYSAENSLIRQRVDLPRNSPSLKLLGHCRICQTAANGSAVCDDALQNRSAVFPIWVEGGHHRAEAIRVGRSHHRAAIVVADREGIGKSVASIRKPTNTAVEQPTRTGIWEKAGTDTARLPPSIRIRWSSETHLPSSATVEFLKSLQVLPLGSRSPVAD